MTFKAIGDYKVYEDGTVVSAKCKKEKTLKPCVTRTGYNWVQLGIEGKRVNWTVHRLVATLFIPNPLNLPEVDHIDGNKANNAVSNLRWSDHKTNCNNINTVKNLRNFNNHIHNVKTIKKLASGEVKEYNYKYVSLQKQGV